MYIIFYIINSYYDSREAIPGCHTTEFVMDNKPIKYVSSYKNISNNVNRLLIFFFLDFILSFLF